MPWVKNTLVNRSINNIQYFLVADHYMDRKAILAVALICLCINTYAQKRTAADQKLVTQGAIIFKQLCATCHGADGKGVTIDGKEFTAPPLAGNKVVGADPNKLIRILLLGLNGPINGKDYPDAMPALGSNSDEYIASALSYVRNEFGHKAPAIKPADVQRERKRLAGRTDSWTMAELDKIKPSVSHKKK
jgi:mono/diheme cytochrome c family protein